MKKGCHVFGETTKPPYGLFIFRDSLKRLIDKEVLFGGEVDHRIWLVNDTK